MKKSPFPPPHLGCNNGNEWFGNGASFDSYTPVDNSLIGTVKGGNAQDYDRCVTEAEIAFQQWRLVPAPLRGEVVRQYGNLLREHKDALGRLVSWEMGKSLQEGWGEVQEMIDICDFAVGLSRQLHGFTMHSERPEHRMYEQYHPLGVVGIISAFNFPVAVWSWNAALALICGNTLVWKPSEKVPFCAIACQLLLQQTLEAFHYPKAISTLIVGDAQIGELMSADPRIALVSATGSTRMGKLVAQKVAGRLGKSLLELGGNNAIIVTPNADIKMTVIGTVFGAVGTCGQRCTSTRRLIVHESIFEQVAEALAKAYQQIRIGNPLLTENHVGPLIDANAVEQYENTLKEASETRSRMDRKRRPYRECRKSVLRKAGHRQNSRRCPHRATRNIRAHPLHDSLLGGSRTRHRHSEQGSARTFLCHYDLKYAGSREILVSCR